MRQRLDAVKVFYGMEFFDTLGLILAGASLIVVGLVPVYRVIVIAAILRGSPAHSRAAPGRRGSPRPSSTGLVLTPTIALSTRALRRGGREPELAKAQAPA